MMNKLERTALLILLLALFFTFLAVLWDGRGQLRESDFSSERALAFLQEWSAEPRSLGTPEHLRAREALIKELEGMGLSPQVQSTQTHRDFGIYSATVDVANVWVRLPGNGNGKTVMFSAHYDTPPHVPGASDDGAAVASMLETIRVLASGEPLRNDLIFMFVDGEEVQLQGSHAFVTQHPLAADIDLILNFEARGVDGPVLLLETTSGNAGLVKAFSSSVANPMGSSLISEFYNLSPSYTDFQEFRNANDGIQGFSFAHIEGITHYHKALDNAANLSPETLAHQGSYMVGLARYLGNSELPLPKTGNATFFNVAWLGFVSFGGGVNLLLIILLIAMMAAAFVFGRKNDHCAVSGVFKGFLAFFSCVLVGAVVAHLVMMVSAMINPGSVWLYLGHPFNTYLYLYGIIGLSAVAVLATGSFWSRKLGTGNFILGTNCLLMLLALATIFLFPGVGYLFMIPALIMATGLAWSFTRTRLDQDPVLWVTGGLGLLGILVIIPTLKLIYVGLDTQLVAASGLITAILAAQWFPAIAQAGSNRKWIYLALAVPALASLAMGHMKNTDQDFVKPKMNSLMYAYDADTSKAFWLSTDPRPDSWVSQYIPTGSERKAMPLFFPRMKRSFLQAEASAPSQPILAPTLEITSDRVEEGKRILDFVVHSPRKGFMVHIFLPSEMPIHALRVGNHDLETPQTWLSWHGNTGSGVPVSITIDEGRTLDLTVMDVAYGFPVSTTPRPEGYLPSILLDWFQDSMIVRKAYTL